MNISHKKITLNYRNFFFKIFFLYIFFTNIAFSEGTKIGSITEINGEVIAITEEGDERILDVYDEIYLKDEILIGESSSAPIQFDDNTTIVMKELTSLNVSEFEKSGAKVSDYYKPDKNAKTKFEKGDFDIFRGECFAPTPQ